ncbi:STAS domain-containing protein [Streptomyces sp. cmx-4-9]|uniref:STAS domain-containing protein n=1 Tax=Streptomyces sp. cmx-4-9 TaxID=2790941 RepID=UPI0039801A4B
MDSDGVLVLPDEGDGARVIVCRGEFDRDTLPPPTAALAAAVAHPSSRIIIDVAQVRFADSSMLNALLRAHRTGRLVLAGPLQRQLARLLEMTGASTVLAVTDGLSTARTASLG